MKTIWIGVFGTLISAAFAQNNALCSVFDAFKVQPDNAKVCRHFFKIFVKTIVSGFLD